MISNIQRFCTHDGPGIRTTVFFKGCPLHCEWCANPETQSMQKEIMYTAHSCLLCGRCVNACKKGALSIESGSFALDYHICDFCGDCISAFG